MTQVALLSDLTAIVTTLVARMRGQCKPHSSEAALARIALILKPDNGPEAIDGRMWRAEFKNTVKQLIGTTAALSTLVTPLYAEVLLGVDIVDMDAAASGIAGKENFASKLPWLSLTNEPQMDAALVMDTTAANHLVQRLYVLAHRLDDDLHGKGAPRPFGSTWTMLVNYAIRTIVRIQLGTEDDADDADALNSAVLAFVAHLHAGYPAAAGHSDASIRALYAPPSLRNAELAAFDTLTDFTDMGNELDKIAETVDETKSENV